jgi:diadenosine tetraphosphate (Ap4A) HIT family hydrolase
MAVGPPCPLCQDDGGALVVRSPQWRIVLVDDPDHPGYLRVIWNTHVTEMSDLDETQRAELMRAVHAVETTLRRFLEPSKINLASLGNQVPHLHWHVIARFAADAHFPNPIWSQRQRETDTGTIDRIRRRLPALTDAIRAALDGRAQPS